MRWLSPITRPFRRLIDRWLDLKHEMSGTAGAVASLLTAPFRWMRDLAAGAMHFLGSIFKELSFLLPVEFVSRWSVTRDYRLLLGSIPALLAGGALLAGAVVATFSEKSTTADHFVNRAIAAKQAGDDEVAELFLRKASITVSGTSESRFNQAVLLQSVGKEADAYALMSQLAPDDKPGYVPAHEWRIQWMSLKLSELATKETPLTEEEIGIRRQISESIEKHLRLIVQAEPEHLKANDRLALIAMGRKKLDEAIEHISRIVDRRPDSRATYAQLFAQSGQEFEARLQAELAVDYHRKILQQDELSDDERWQNRARLAHCYMILQDYEGAVESLTDNGAVPKLPVVRNLLARIFFQWSASIKSEDGPSLIRQLNLLNQALELNPGNAAVLQAIASIAGKPGKPGAIANKTLKDVLSTGQAPPLVHFVIAMNAAAKDDFDTAKMHLELAHAASPKMPIVLNNLAYVIASEKEPDFQRAMQLVDQAIELDPSVGDFYDTRGSILTKLGKWKDAISDLERALKMIPGRAAIHRKLAACYEAVGDPELAALHRTRAEKKERAANSERRK